MCVCVAFGHPHLLSIQICNFKMLIMIKMLKSRNTITILLFLAAHIPLQFDSMTDAKATGQRTRSQAEATECRMNNKQNRTKPKKKNATIFWLFLVFYGQSVTHTLARRMENNEWLMDMDVLYRQCALCVCVSVVMYTFAILFIPFLCSHWDHPN